MGEIQAKTQTTVGVIGVGQMGRPMADRILERFKTIVYDKSDEGLKHFAGRARIAKDPVEALSEAEVMVLCLPTVQAYIEAAAAASQLGDGTRLRTLVVAGTTGSSLVDDMVTMLRDTDIEVLDAPVTGGPHGAKLGTLTSMVAGSAAALKRAQPVIDSYSKQTIIFGPTPGAAQTMKLVNNLLSVANLVLTGEAMTLGLKAGLDPEKMFEVLTSGTAQNYAISSIFPRCVFTRSFDFGGHLELGAKDYKCLMEEAERQGVNIFAAKAVQTILMDAIGQQGMAADFSAIVKYFEASAGVEFPRTR